MDSTKFSDPGMTRAEDTTSQASDLLQTSASADNIPENIPAAKDSAAESSNLHTDWKAMLEKSSAEDVLGKLCSADDENSLVETSIWLAEHTTEHVDPKADEIDPGDILSCICCYGILSKAYTFDCGHSLCSSCRDKIGRCPLPGGTCRDLSNVVLVMSESGNRVRVKQEQGCNVNVLLSKLVSEIIFPGEPGSSALRNEGNALVGQGKLVEALALYDQGLNKCPYSHILHGNRCHVLLSLNRFHEALAAADTCIVLQPKWAKGHYRRGLALEGLGDKAGALSSFVRCCVLLREHFDRTMGHGVTRTDCQSAESQVHQLVKHLSTAGGGPPAAAAALRASRYEAALQRTPAAAALLAARRACLARCAAGGDHTFAAAASNEPAGGAAHADGGGSASASDELECKLCFATLYEPTTTPCGHTFCRPCLIRCLDHNPACPYCRASLLPYLAAHRGEGHRLDNTAYCAPTAALWALVRAVLPPAAVEERRAQVLAQEAAAAESSWIPVFVCSLALPTVKCPLHIFEPRYRLMLRRCVETTRTFGMCLPAINDAGEVTCEEYGTLLHINECSYTPDGRVLERGERDGYMTARVEWIVDDPIDSNDEQAGAELAGLHEQARRLVASQERAGGGAAAAARHWAALTAQLGPPPAESAADLSFWLAGVLAATALHDSAVRRLGRALLPDRSPVSRLRHVLGLWEGVQPARRCAVC